MNRKTALKLLGVICAAFAGRSIVADEKYEGHTVPGITADATNGVLIISQPPGFTIAEFSPTTRLMFDTKHITEVCVTHKGKEKVIKMEDLFNAI